MRLSSRTDEQQCDEGELEHARLTLESMGPLGDTWARHNGERVNIFGGIPGEEVIARLIRYKRRRRQQVSGIVTEVLKPSPHRVAPPCPYFGACSGCQWQHIEYTHQLRLKRDAVEAELRRYPDLDGFPIRPTIPSPQLFNYRNHARFTVRQQGSIGYVNRISRSFVRIDECMLMAPWINETLRLFQGHCAETSQITMRYGINTGDWLIQPTLQNPELVLATGQTHYGERLLDRRFRIASPSFFQVNTKQAEQLTKLLGARLELAEKDLLVDAYAGVGTFAVAFAPQVRRVVAIEESAAAVEDASANTKGIDNIELVVGKTEDVLDSLENNPDAVILDPPRVGCHPHALQALGRRRPDRVVYVSCEPETLARDLHLLTQEGFLVKSVEPLDMFPQTHHVECVAALEFRK